MMPTFADARAATARGGRDSARLGGGRALPVRTHGQVEGAR